MSIPDKYKAINLIDFNVGAAASVAFLNPLAAQLDAAISLGFGPFQTSLAAQFNAALAAQASLSLTLSVGDIGLIAALKASIAALASLQAALAGALALPPVQLSLSAELTATAALAATLKIQLGGIQLLIKAMLAVKIPAIQLASQISAALNVGPFFAITFSDSTPQQVSAWLSGEVASGGLSADGCFLSAGAPTFGILIVAQNPSASAKASFDAIISVP